MNIILGYGNNNYLLKLSCNDKCQVKQIKGTFSTSTNNTNLSRAESLSLLVKTNGRAGGRPKTSRKIQVYKNLLSLDEDLIKQMIFSLGINDTTCIINKLVRSNLYKTVTLNMKIKYENILNSLSNSVREYLETRFC